MAASKRYFFRIYDIAVNASTGDLRIDSFPNEDVVIEEVSATAGKTAIVGADTPPVLAVLSGATEIATIAPVADTAYAVGVALPAGVALAARTPVAAGTVIHLNMKTQGVAGGGSIAGTMNLTVMISTAGS